MDLLLVLGLAVMCGLVILFFFLGVGRVITKRDQNEQFHSMIDSLSKSEIDLERRDAGLPDPKTWSGYWYTLAQGAGSKVDNPGTPGIMAMGLALLGFGFGFLVWPRDILGGLIGIFVALFFIRVFYKHKSKARLALIDRQLPQLLSGIRANLQANLTPQQAIINQAKEIPFPLGAELKILTEEMAVGITLDTALRNFGQRIPSREIQFLVSAIRIAIQSGADLDPLIATIQKIVVQRTRIANHLRSAVAKAQPAMWVTGVMIPAGYLFSFYSDPKNQAFWLSLPFGLICTIIIAMAYALGLFLAKKQIDRVRNA